MERPLAPGVLVPFLCPFGLETLSFLCVAQLSLALALMIDGRMDEIPSCWMLSWDLSLFRHGSLLCYHMSGGGQKNKYVM